MKVTTTNPRDFIELLEVFSIALTNGLLDKEEVIKWADNIITQDEEPDYFIIELSLCGHKSINDIVSLINEYVGQDKPKISGRIFLGLLYRAYLTGHIKLDKVTRAIYWIVWEDRLTEDEKSLIYGIDEDYDCAIDGIYGSVEIVEKEVLRFLEIYKDFQIDNFDDWKEIDITIEPKVIQLSDLVRQENKIIITTQTEQTKKIWWKFWTK
ncbi:MAG TPA: hypothetical protein VK152_02300 [Paludibacter sp.]|nr:hypothetical protein [Paludibacter sp.]